MAPFSAPNRTIWCMMRRRCLIAGRLFRSPSSNKVPLLSASSLNAANLDADNFLSGSVYYTDDTAGSNTVSHRPADGCGASIIWTLPAAKNDDKFLTQLWFERYKRNIFLRTKDGPNGWGPWKRLATDEDLAKKADTSSVSLQTLSGLKISALYNLFVAANALSTSGLISESCDFATFATKLPMRVGLSITCNSDSPIITDLPGKYGQLLILKGYNENYRNALFINNSGTFHYAHFEEANPSKNGWRTVATTEPPTWYNLPLASNITNMSSSAPATYCKSQDGVVSVHGWLSASTAPASGSAVNLAILPVGYRPKHNIRRVVIVSTPSPNLGLARIEITTNGTIQIVAWNGTGTLKNGVSIDASFAAAP